jgi:hypothetical protein
MLKVNRIDTCFIQVDPNAHVPHCSSFMYSVWQSVRHAYIALASLLGCRMGPFKELWKMWRPTRWATTTCCMYINYGCLDLKEIGVIFPSLRDA